MYVLIFLIAVVVLLFGGSHLFERRRRRRIVEMIAAKGGQVVRIDPTAPVSSRRKVRYIGPQGELREAVVASNLQDMSEDRPFQFALRERYKDAGSDMLRALQLAATLDVLPGYEAYKKLMLGLAANPDKPISIEESPADLSSQQNRFAPTLQCLEVAAIGSDEGQLLKLTINGNNFDVSWSVAGQAPHRSLLITATPSQGPPVDLKREAENRASSK